MFSESSCCDKKQVTGENHCGTGNEGRGIRPDSKVWEAVQSTTGAHIPLVLVFQNEIKILFSFDLCVLFFQMAAKLLGYKYLLSGLHPSPC